MSEIKVNSIKGVGASAAAITVNNTDGTCTANITNNLSNRNKIINGSMICSQRGTTFSPDGTEQPYTLDRFQHVATGGADGDCTVTQSTDAPTGFKNSYKITPDATNTPTGGGNVTIRHQIEGQDLQDLNYGTSSAKSLTISFYAKTASGNSGDQYTLCLFYARQDSTQKTVTVAFTPTSTYQRFSFTFAGDTDASYGMRNDNGSGITATWVLAAGSDDIKAAKSTWEVDGGYFRGVTGQDNFMDNTSNEFYLTGVQLEVGSVATDFEHRSHADELQKCLRYFYQITKIGSTSEVTNKPIGVGMYYTASDYRCHIEFPVEMRAVPTFASNDNSNSFYIHYNANADFIDKMIGMNYTKKRGTIRNNVNTNGTQGYVGFLNQETGDSNLSFSAEL
jgi:hypothetical protein